MSKLIFDTKTLNLSEILGNSKSYIVPKYQRSYSWHEEQLEDLWQDIIALKKNEENVHYLGTIVLKTTDNKNFEIIDGQQRLITLSIILLACMKIFDNFINQKNDPEKNKQRKEIYLNNYIGFKETKALTYQPKLTLNFTDKDLYSGYLVQLKIPPAKSKLCESNQLMIKCLEYFYEKLKEINFQSGEELVDFIENILLNRLILIQILSEDVVSAYTIFETLNARGTELTTTDLLKNYLISLLDNEIDIANILPVWNRIVNIVSYKEFPTFLRYYINSQQDLIRQERLFKELKIIVQNKEQVFRLLEDLEKNAELYVAFDDYEHEYWKENHEIQDLIREINLFGVKQHKSLLISCYNKIRLDEFLKVLRIIRSISFRYNVIGKINPNNLEKAYNRVSVKVYKNHIATAREIQKELASVYLTDEEFRNIFLTKTFNTDKTSDKKLVRYILISIENQRYRKNYHLFESDATIEHIYPINSPENELTENIIYRLGNFTLLEPEFNKKAANKIFKEKIEIYKKSQYSITGKIAEIYDKWDEDSIKNRQKEFADIATSIWKTNY